MKTILFKLAFVAMLCASLLFSCTSDLEMPPPPEDTISSSAQVWSYCVYPEIEMCYPGSYSACPGIGGELRNDCPYSNSNPVPSSSSSGGGITDNSSSSQNEQGNEQEYNYCVFAAERNCLTGPLTLCPPGGELSNTCPYNSSSSKQSSSSSVAGSSSSQGIKSSSSSQAVGQGDGNVFTDPRDGKKYKFEVATDGKIWMSENLNYSRDNTLGYCYGVDINGANPHRDSTTCNNGYGRLYEWTVAMDGKSSQGLCPNGWHIPSTAEWSSVVSDGAKKMSNDFYIYPGNYNLNTAYPPIGWKERDKSGFYWTSSGNSYFTGFFNEYGTEWVQAQTGATIMDNYSVRCLSDEKYKFLCGTVEYSPLTHFCSGTEILPLCGGKEYKPATEFCSGTNVYSLCSGKTYNPSTQECVGTTLYSKCGTTLYLPSTHFCSGTEIVPLCGGKEYNPAFEECVSGTVTAKEALCGGKAYILETHFCSGNSIYSRCGGKEYRPEIFECVNGVLNPIAADYVITCNGMFDDNNCGNNKRRVTLRVNECVEINVMGYTNQYLSPNLIMRCETPGISQGNVSVTLSLNGTSKTYSGSIIVQPIVELGKIKLGDNKFGFLCVTDISGVTSINCMGPDQ